MFGSYKKCSKKQHAFSYLLGLLAVFTTLAAQGYSDEPVDGFSKNSENQVSQIGHEEQSFGPKKPSSYSRGNSLLEAKAGYFFFSDDKMRKVFNAGGWDVQLCGSFPLSRWLQLYGSIEYLERHGKSLQDHQRTSIREIPLSLGLKPVVKISEGVQYYFTFGPRYFFVHTHSHSSFMDKNLNSNGLGGFVNTGFNFFPWNGALLIDVFGEYSYKRLHFHPHKANTQGRTVQVGGFCFGFGLGRAF